MESESKKTILLIEDDKTVLENLKIILQFENFLVETAMNGRLGILKALAIKPDLIICDIAMPEMNGFAVLDFIRKTTGLFDVPFIFLTAISEPQELRKGMNLGADDYITKPFEISAIIESVNTRLQKHSMIKKYFDSQIKEFQNIISSTIPHELRSPLNTILGFTYLLKSNLNDLNKDEISSMINSIELSAKRLHRLVNNYTYYLQLQNNPEFLTSDNISQTTFNSDLVIKSIAGVVGSKYTNNTCSLELVVSPIKISEEGFIKIIEELADNAFKFSFPNSKIEIRTEILNEFLAINFINEGIGFPEDKISSIGAFKQFDRKKYEQQGSGLGLAIVKNICDLYNSSLNIAILSESKTCVTVKIPVAENLIN